MKTSKIRAAGAGLVLILVTGACGSTAATDTSKPPAQPTGASTPAGDLRAGIQAKLGMHVILVTEATGATFAGRSVEFAGARAALLGINADEVAASIGGAYGAKQTASIRSVWAKHIGSILDYASALKTSDGDLRDSSLLSLIEFTKDFGAAVEALPAEGLTQDLVANLFREHILRLKSVIEAQHTRGPGEVIGEQLKALAQASSMSSSIAAAIAAEKKLSGDPVARAVELRSSLSGALQEHVALLMMASDASAAGSSADLKAAGDVLRARNAVTIAATFASYGPAVEKVVLGRWREQVAGVLDYSAAAVRSDRAGMAQAAANLMTSATEIGKAVHEILADVPVAKVEDLLVSHSKAIMKAIDERVAERFEAGSVALVPAISALDVLAANLADAIVNDQKKK